ncbi:nuclease-related domain-containing protein [Paenibacillus sp. JSM ZJ436]|uniref:nuclease-related domain-containing protein n=1 Tax=Paenibacillus sp. JSM ZJ436 TaxID=3376190 RepID=UPI0037986982
MAVFVLMLKDYENEQKVVYSYGPNEETVGKIEYDKKNGVINQISAIVSDSYTDDFFFKRAGRRCLGGFFITLEKSVYKSAPYRSIQNKNTQPTERSLHMLKKLLSLFKSSTPDKKKPAQSNKANAPSRSKPKPKPKVEPTRIGQLGEHKINIQLDQLPKGCNFLSDLMVANSKSRTGYSQIDHVVITPQGLFVIETKNYNGEIKGSRQGKSWTVSGRFKMYNPFMQNYGHIQAIKQNTGRPVTSLWCLLPCAADLA